MCANKKHKRKILFLRSHIRSCLVCVCVCVWRIVFLLCATKCLGHWPYFTFDWQRLFYKTHNTFTIRNPLTQLTQHVIENETKTNERTRSRVQRNKYPSLNKFYTPFAAGLRKSFQRESLVLTKRSQFVIFFPPFILYFFSFCLVLVKYDKWQTAKTRIEYATNGWHRPAMCKYINAGALLVTDTNCETKRVWTNL